MAKSKKSKTLDKTSGLSFKFTPPEGRTPVLDKGNLSNNNEDTTPSSIDDSQINNNVTDSSEDEVPIRFFHSSTSQYSASEIKNMVSQYGKNIIISGDEGHGDSFLSAMEAVDKYGAKKGVYLVGPGMMSWSAAEVEQIKEHARDVGVDTQSGDWHNTWIEGRKWEEKNQKQFKYYGEQGYFAAEIDNLDSAFTDESTFTTKYIKFLYRLSNFLNNNNLAIKLVAKNLSEECLEKIIEEVKSPNGYKITKLLANFAMMEAGSGDPETQIKLCKKLKIQAITPSNGLQDTYNYGTIRTGISYDV